MERLQRALQALVDDDYGTWGGVNHTLREAVAAFAERFPELPVNVPDDDDGGEDMGD